MTEDGQKRIYEKIKRAVEDNELTLNEGLMVETLVGIEYQLTRIAGALEPNDVAFKVIGGQPADAIGKEVK
jgi:hypothetical protein